MAVDSLAQRAQPLALLLFLVFALNLLDAALTVLWVRTGLCTEANPLLRWLAHEEQGLFMLVKVAVVGTGLGILWTFRSCRLAGFGLRLLLVAYVGVALYHSGIMVGLVVLPAF
jgi:hypothetical protein